jgi:hypothetical protein
LISIAAGLVLPSALALAFRLDTAGYPGIGLPEPELTALGLALLAWLGLQVVALVGWVARAAAGRWAAAALLFGLGVLLGLIPSLAIGMAAKLRVAQILTERAEPVIAAVEKFHSDRGFWPKAIEDMVPEYLPEVPRTGSPNYPDLFLVNRAEDFGNPWVLEIPMYEALKFDALYYCPEVDCEAQVRSIGGGTTRIGKWVFLNE